MTLLQLGLGFVAGYSLYNIIQDKKASENVENFVQHWLDTVCTHDADAVVELYSQDATLLGTLADDIKTGKTKIKSYFNYFLSQKPCGHITSIFVTSPTPDIAVANGTYTFSINGEDVPARFTYVLKKSEDNWKILTHHSSLQPE